MPPRRAGGDEMLGPTGAEVVLWLHVVAATVWIGGQVVVAAVVPLTRPHPGLGAAVGRRFQVVAWPAFAVLVLTGIANLRHVGIGAGDLLDTPVGRTMTLKLGLVLLSGVAAAVHVLVQAPRASRAATPSAATSAVLGSVSVLAAIAAALLGVVVHGA